MSESGYWTRTGAVSRRGLLRGAGMAGVGLSAAALIGCSSSSSNNAQKPAAPGAAATASGTSAPLPLIKVAIPSDAQSGDGAITGGGSWPITSYVYDRLLFQSRINGSNIPMLATSWKATDNVGKIWEFKLRPDVKFHNGQTMTADDVAYTYQRLLDPKVKATRAATTKAAVETVEVVDPLTVRFRLTKADVTWPSGASQDNIVPRAYASQVGPDEFAAKPVGTGPFVFKSRSINNQIEYTAHTGYWNKDAAIGLPTVPGVPGALLRILPEAETRIAALLAGEVDIVANLPSTALKRLSGEKNVQIIQEDTGQPLALVIDSLSTKGAGGGPNPYKDKRVRQALNYAINLDEIIAKVLTGKEQPSTGISRNGLGADNALKPYPFDPQKAMALLKEAGYENKIKGDDAVIWNPGARWEQSEDICNAIAGYLRKVGIEATVRTQDYATVAAQLAAKKSYPMCFWGMWPGPESISAVEFFMLNPAIRGMYQGNPQIDSLTAKVRAELDDTARGKLYAQIQNTFFEDAGHVFLHSALYTHAARGGWTWKAGRPLAGEVAIWEAKKA